MPRNDDHGEAGATTRSLISEIGIGVVAAAIAVGFRLLLPLRPDQLPTAPVIVVLAVVATFVGLRAGMVTAFLGGLASWYLFFNPRSWSLAGGAWIPLLGYAIIAVVILTTSQLYRASERRSREKEIARLQAEAETSRLFARELAHRLGNTLAIVQSIATQTFGKNSPESHKFAGRLKALAEANQLLTAHVETPTAKVAEVVETALRPFRGERQAFRLQTVDATIEASQVLSLALALHELATNALKYGALSVPAGSVALTVAREGEGLTLTWKERDGPRVVEPERQGFGTRLLLRSGATTKLDFQDDGVRCTIAIPAAVVA